MKYALISDIHANAEALDRVLMRVDTLHVDVLLFLGDGVGYGPSPNRCLDLIRNRCTSGVAGNHDHAVIGRTNTANFNLYAQKAVYLTSSILESESYRYLSELEYEWSDGEVRGVHAAPCDPPAWTYVFSVTEAARQFSCFEETLCFIGHSHIPAAFSIDRSGHVEQLDAVVLEIRPERRYLINVGSVGQPRDGDSRAAFGIYDGDSGRYELMRIEYDISETQKKMTRLGLPDYLINRLRLGR